jgi:hypothetical protein
MPQRSVSRGLLKAFFKDMGTLSVLFLVVYLAGVPLVGALIQLLQGNGFLFVFPLDAYYRTTFVWSCAIFMLVLGIIMPLYLGLNMSLGVTRREHTAALLIVGVSLCLLFAVFDTVLQAFFGIFYLLSIPTGFVVILSAYLGGWVIVLGFQFRRVTTAIGGFLVVGVLVSALTALVGVEQTVPGGFGIFLFGTELSYAWPDIAGYAVLCALFIALIVPATKHVAIKS